MVARKWKTRSSDKYLQKFLDKYRINIWLLKPIFCFLEVI